MTDLKRYPSVQPKTLASDLSSTDTLIKLTEIKDWGGNDLTSSQFSDYIPATLINDSKSKVEFILLTASTIANATTTGITIYKRGLKYYAEGDSTDIDEVTANKLSWTAGETKVLLGTNPPYMYGRFPSKDNDETITETWTFTNPNLPKVDTYEAPTDDEQFATKKYVDDVAIAGSPDATETVKGISEIATTDEIDAGTEDGGTSAKLVVNPSALSTSIYATRLPSADQKAALAGTSGTPATGNKYVTNDDTSATAAANKLVRAGAGGKIAEGYLQMTDAQVAELISTVATYLHTHGHSHPIFDKAIFGVNGFDYSKGKDWAANCSETGSLVNNTKIATLVAASGTADDYGYCIAQMRGQLDTLGLVGTLSFINGFAIEANVLTEAPINATNDVFMFIGLPPVAYGSVENIRAIDEVTFQAKHIGFIWEFASSAWKLYTTCGDGTTQNLSSAIVGYTDPTSALDYRIIYDLTNIKFYIGGTLISTLTTNLPTGATVSDAYPGVYVFSESGGGTTRFGNTTINKSKSRAAISFA